MCNLRSRIFTNILIQQVVISDFPDASLVNNIAKNIELNIGKLNEKSGVASTSAVVRNSYILALILILIVAVADYSNNRDLLGELHQHLYSKPYHLQQSSISSYYQI